MSELDFTRVGTLWFVTLGITSLVGAVLIYYLTLESTLGAFSIHETYPPRFEQHDQPRVALLRSGYTKQAYRALNPSDSAAWVDGTLRSWRQLLLDRSRGIAYSEISDARLEAGQLDGFNVLILPSTSALSDRQIEHIKAFVDRGGSVMATFAPGIYYPDGSWRGWSFMEEVFGLEFVDFVDRQAGNYRVYQDTFPGTTPPGLYRPDTRFDPFADTTLFAAEPDSATDADATWRAGWAPPDLFTAPAVFDTTLSADERHAALAAYMQDAAERARFAPLSGYRWSDSLGAVPPQANYALADTLTAPLRDLDGTLRPQQAVVVRYYTWLGTGVDRPFPYPQTGSGIRRFTLRGNTPLTAGIPAGYRVKVQVYNGGVRTRVLEPRTRAAGFWYDFATDATPVDEGIETTTGAAYGTYGAGRFVYLGAQRDVFGVGRDDPEDLEHLGTFFANILNYLRRKPIVWTHAWPAPHTTAALLSGIGDRQIDHFAHVDNLLQREGLTGSYFVRPEVAVAHQVLLQRLHARGDVGVLDDLIREDDGAPSFQQERLRQLKRKLETLVGAPVYGYRSTREGMVSHRTMAALRDAGYRYFEADSLDRVTSPHILGHPFETLTRIGITARSDRSILTRLAGEAPDVQAAPFQEDLRRVRHEGSLYHLAYSSDVLADPIYNDVLRTIVQDIRQESTWTPSAEELADWWRLRRGIQTNIEQRGPNRIIVRISNANGTPVEFVRICVSMGRPVDQVDISSELVQMIDPVVPDHVLAEDNNVLYLSLSKIKPQQVLVYRIDLLDAAGNPYLASAASDQ